jgi:hypothetical protein
MSLAAVLFGLGAGPGGCALGRGGENGKVEIWRSGDQFVRLERLKIPGGSPPPNVHPVWIYPERMRNALALLGVKDEPRDAPRQLFTPASLEILSRGLAAGLAQALPDQDVTFAVEQSYRGFLGLTDTRVISGRVFYTGDWLHLIFGSVLRGNVADEDLYFDPYMPGSRHYSVGHYAILWAPPGSGVYRAPGGERDDWLVIAPQMLAGRPPAPPAQPVPYRPR